MKPTAKDWSRFWAKVQKTESCWLWTGSRRKSARPYGQFWFDGRLHQAHRWLYEVTHGLLDASIDVCHSCDVPECVNPAHLFAGTRSDNILDCAKKGRHGRMVVTETDVLEIRRRAAAGETNSQLGAAFGVHKTTIGCIVRRHTWVHVGGG